MAVMIEFVLLILVVFVFLYFYEWFKQLTGKCPPGPIGLPLFGYTFFLGSNEVKRVQDLSKKYGKIMKINLYGNDYYILNDFELINEAYNKQGDNFSGRPVNEFNVIEFVFGDEMLMCLQKDVFNVHRKFLLSKLNLLGIGKSYFDEIIIKECDSLISKIEKLNEKPFEVFDYLLNYTSNIIYGVFCSKSLEMNDPLYTVMRRAAKSYYNSVAGLDGLFYGKWIYLKKRLNTKIYEGMVTTKRILYEITSAMLNERLNSEKIKGQEDLMDYFIDALKNDPSMFTEMAIVSNLSSLLLDIPEFATVLFYHFINQMVLNPDIQQKVQREIDEVVGRENTVTYQHKQYMNYTRAVICEIERYVCVVPMGLVRVNHNEATLNGFKIPKRSKVMANHWSVSRDKKYFKNPDVFDPNNFLDDNGVFKKSVAHIPFSCGKRICIGMKLAEVETFITFTKLLQSFTWKAETDEISAPETKEGLVRQLDPFKVIALKR